MPNNLTTDIAIVGGGIAGLWLNARLRQQGFNTLLIEQHSLGGQQTVKSQGIIHGGTKYALHGALTGSSEAIADMPARWRTALDGNGELDLRGVRLLSEAHYLWSPGSVTGNLTSFFASKAMRGRVDVVKGANLPPALQDKAFKGRVYRLAELVFDVPSLIARLAELAGDSLLHAPQLTPVLDNGQLAGLHTGDINITAQRYIFTAGEGNAQLLTDCQLEQPRQQLRPLHMVLVKGPQLKPVYAHCLGGGTKPRITITTHPAADGQWAWYLGGNLAEADGVARDEAAQVSAARHELHELMPWLDQTGLEWHTLRINRAEPAQNNLVRPDNAFLHVDPQLMVAWPTKLALAPDLADRVLEQLQQQGVQAQTHAALPQLPRPSVAPAPWEELF